MTTVAPTVTFEAPGPGEWLGLGDHFPRALTPEYQAIYAATAPPGMKDYMARYGVLVDGIDVAFVNGHLYLTPVPLVGPREAKRPPPYAAVWLMARLHPGMRRRRKAADVALAGRPWRAVTDHWFTVERAEWAERDAAMESVDPDDLDGVELAGHLAACRRLVLDGYRRHFELHGDDLLPQGLFIAQAQRWGISGEQAAAALVGASPQSAGTEDPPAWKLVTGYDLDSLAWCELTARPKIQAAPPVEPLDLRLLVPRAHHEELAALLADARRAIPLRDDNGVYTGSWPMGLLRRAMLATGRRLGFDHPTLAIEATVAELLDRLGGVGEPSAEQLSARRAERDRCSEHPPPDQLGATFPRPPLTALPVGLRLMAEAQLVAAEHMRGTGTAVGVGEQPYTGRVVVVSDPLADFESVEPGDVVVTRSTSPSWNNLLVLAGGLVTASGGVVSHAAVIARELGIPALIGDPAAFARMRTGMTVTLDPRARTVSVVASG